LALPRGRSELFMSHTGPFRVANRMRSLVPALGLVLLSFTTGVASGSPSSTTQRIDCDAINAGILKTELTGAARTTRAVTLEAGEALEFSFDSVAGRTGSLALVAGPGSPRRLLAGPAGTTARFVAPMQGTFEFALASDSELGATFTAICTPVQSAEQSDSEGNRPTARQPAGLHAGVPDPDQLPAPETPALRIDSEAWRSVLDRQLKELDASSVTASPAGLAPVRRDGVDVWLGADGKRVSLTAPPKSPPNADASALSEGGLNYELLPQIMVGALVQLEPQGPPSLLERSWMAGPMTSLKLAPGISLDARAAWGESRPAASQLSAGGPGAERHQVNARLANTQTFGRWRFSSSMAVDYLEITRQSAGLSADDPNAPQTVGSGHVSIRPELSYRLDVDGSTFIEPKAAISSLWDIESLSELAPGLGPEAMRLKAEAGVTIGTSSGTTLQATGALQEGAGDATDVWSGRLQLKVPLK